MMRSTLFLVAMKLAALVLFVWSLAGCKNFSWAGLARVGADAFNCAPSEYGAVQNAIEQGGPSWISAVTSLLPCVPAVVRDFQAMAELEERLRRGERVRFAGPLLVPKHLTIDQRRRLAAAHAVAECFRAVAKP
jgi:hypothetical protein